MSVEGESRVSGELTLRGVEYLVGVEAREGALTVEVEERGTADQWRNTFQPDYIEDMTKKTGNFKKFSVFVSMLESAITSSSDVVTLDLLTYSDLELLRSRKAGTQTVPPPPRSASVLNAKRYLIVTYSVEFDRVHYPLPLPYMGKPDPRLLQQTIRQLKKEIRTLQMQVLKDYRSKELESLKRDYDRLANEKEVVEMELSEYRRERANDANVGKEVRVLKGVIKNLQEELTTERTRHQRAASKRSQQYRQLVDELEEVRASERNLRTRVKSLVNELTQYKRKGSRPFPLSLSLTDRDLVTLGSSRPSSRRSLDDRSRLSDRSHLSDRSRLSDRSSGRSRLNELAAPRSARERSMSRERTLTRRVAHDERARSSSLDRAPNSRESSRDRVRAEASRRTRTPSPIGSRFDPTAYAAERKRQLKEIELKQKRLLKSRQSGSGERKRRPSPAAARSNPTTGVLPRYRSRPSRSPSISSTASLGSSVESLSEIGPDSDASLTHIRLSSRRSKPHMTDLSQPAVPTTRSKNTKKVAKVRSSTPDKATKTQRAAVNGDNKENLKSDANEISCDRSAELSDIDARLNRLQEFMKANLK